MPSGCLSTKDRTGVGWAVRRQRRENNSDDVGKRSFSCGVVPDVGCNKRNVCARFTAFSFSSVYLSWNFTTLFQLWSNHTPCHYQLIKAGSNQKEWRYNIRFDMCDPIRMSGGGVFAPRLPWEASWRGPGCSLNQKTVRNQQPADQLISKHYYTLF